MSSPSPSSAFTNLTTAIKSHDASLTKVLLANNAFSSSSSYAMTEPELQQALDTTFRELALSYYTRRFLLRELQSSASYGGNLRVQPLSSLAWDDLVLMGVFSVPAKTARELIATYMDDVVALEREIGVLRTKVEAKRWRDRVRAAQWREAEVMVGMVLLVLLTYLGTS